MEPSLEFLKRFLHEDLYLVNESGSDQQDDAQNRSAGEMESPKQKTTISNKTLIILNLPGRSHTHILTDAFLKKVLEAVKLTITDVMIINISDTEGSGPDPESFRLENCYMLGFLEKLPSGYSAFFKDQKYEVHSVKGAHSLWADPLEQIEEDRSLKVKLWKSLQEIYPIK